MQYTIERLVESQVAVDVQLESARVEKALNQAARRIAQKVRIPGFRPGKAPRNIIEARFGRASLYEEAIDDLVRGAYREILENGEFDPIAEAELDITSIEPFAFRLTIPVRPTVTLGDYRSLRFAEAVEGVTEEDVQAVLDRLQAEQTIWQTPDPPRPARQGDRLTVDWIEREGDETVQDQANVPLALGEADLPSELSEGLLGVESGQTVEIEATLPGDPQEEQPDREVVYTITVRDIKEPEVPPLDDEFALSFGQEKTLEEMRGRILGELEEIETRRARGRVLDQMIEAIVEGAEIDMPQALVNLEADELYKAQEAQLRSSKISMAQFCTFLGKTEEEYRDQLKEGARVRVRRSLVLQEVAQAEGLADEDDLAEKLEQRLLAIARGELAEDAEVADEPRGDGSPGEVEPETDAAAQAASEPSRGEPAEADTEEQEQSEASAVGDAPVESAGTTASPDEEDTPEGLTEDVSESAGAPTRE